MASGHVLAVVTGCIGGFVGTPADMVNVRSVRP